MNNVIKRVWNQNKMVAIEDLKGMTFQAESGGHTFQISGVDDAGNVIALSGSVAGVFLRPDNTDVAITGSASGGVISVTLPANCYDVPGRFGLTIFITSGSSKTAIYAAVGTVTRTSSGTVAPGTSKSVVDLINAINAAVNSIPASYSALLADIAPTYSNSALYSVGQYAWYDGDLKRCIVPITTAESYTAAHWTSAVLGQDVSDLKSALSFNNGNVIQEFQSGYITTDVNTGAVVQINTVTPSGTIVHSVVDCESGDVFSIRGKGAWAARLWAFVDTDNKLISKSSYNLEVDNLVLQAPENAKKIIVNIDGAGTLIKGATVNNRITDLTSVVNSNNSEVNGEIIESDIVTMAYMGKMLTGNDLLSLVWENGTIDASTGLPIPHTNECRTQFIPTLKGLTVNVWSTTEAYYYLSKYDKNKNFIEKSSGIRTVTFSGDTCAFVRISGYASTRESFLQGVRISTDIDRDLIIEKKKSSNLLYGMIGGSLYNGTINKNPDSASGCISDDYIEVEGGETYTLKFGELSAAGLAVYFAQYNSSKTYISTISKYAITNEISVKLDQSAAYVMIMLYYQWTADIWTDWCPKDITFAKSILPISYVLPNEITDYVDPDKIYKRITDGMAVNKLSADLKIPGYYFDSSYLPGKVNSIRSAITGSDGNIDVFFFITDMHWTLNQKRSPALINYINSSLRIPMIVNGGDDMDGGYGISKVLKDAMYNGDVYDAIGNHEYLSSGNDASNYLYYTMRLNHVDGGNAVRGYYYFDNNIIKTRYIVLSAYQDNGGSATVGYEQTQLDWLNSVMNVGTGWKIIIFTHFFMNTMNGNILSQSAYDLIEQHEHSDDVVAIIEGHQHYDGVIRTATGIPVIGVTCDKNEPWISEGVDMEPWLSDRTSGTIKEQAFDVMLINHTAKTITQYRIGCPIRDGTDPEAWTEMESRTTSYDR